MKRASGFTLVELLVVVGVIALLGSLILPGLAQARRGGKAVSCLANLRQWGVATHLYAGDHDDYLPPDGTPNPGPGPARWGWYVQLPDHMGLPSYHGMLWRTNAAASVGRSVWICPANVRRSNGRNLFHYCLNEHVSGTGEDAHAARLGGVPNPQGLVWLFDSKNLPAVGSWSYTHTNLHGRGAQFLCLDGRVVRLAARQYWDASRGKARVPPEGVRWLPTE